MHDISVLFLSASLILWVVSNVQTVGVLSDVVSSSRDQLRRMNGSQSTFDEFQDTVLSKGTTHVTKLYIEM